MPTYDHVNVVHVENSKRPTAQGKVVGFWWVYRVPAQ